MKLGCCLSGMDQVAALQAAGGDYYELPVAPLVMAEGERSSPALLSAPAGFRLRPLAYNVLLPPSIAAVGPSADRGAIERYLGEAFTRMGRLGGNVVVFGSGRSRSIPDGFDRRAALDQLEHLVKWASAAARAHGLVVALEPLRRAESNIFNTVAECVAFVRERELNGVRLVADSYHMLEQGEPLRAIDAAADLLAHVHVADTARRPPGQGDYDFAAFFRRLRAAGYRGLCSIECRWHDFANEVGPSLGYVRQVMVKAGWPAG